ncbi:ATP-binding protein [Dyadobacter sp. CY312]|uniref:ATP-binding protein n=1 Tax=Dyadobacter sp. CY312 TaxID=2907303 RepID=UPI001F20C159|nr:ATP-binding protein [Dyadobacter sp. CY312]MCE7042428.1 ATP-binding protein [Dyadobacter sp. CY312]
MKNPLKTASLSSFIWIILLIVILISFVFVTLMKDSKSQMVRNNITALNQENENYQKLDSCISVLYEAENNSRLFVTTLDSSYIHIYKQQIAYVSHSLAEFEASKKRLGLPLSSLIVDKKIKDEQFVKMRMLVDSLLSFSFELRNSKPIVKSKPIPLVKTTRRIAKTDSVFIDKNKSKKRLFKRIAEAIANKEPEGKSLARAESSIIIKDSMLLTGETSGAGGIDIFEQYEKARMQLNATERQMLLINGRIFANLKKALRGMRAEEEAHVKAFRTSLVKDMKYQFEEVNRLSSGSVFIVLALTIMIIWNLVKLYRQENTLLKYARVTAETTRKKGEFMSHVAHEIRTPLNSVIGFAQLIDAEKLDDELKGNVNAIKNSSKTLLTLVNEILDFSKFESGKITLKSQPFLPAVILGEAEDMLSVLAAEKKIVLRKDYQFSTTLNLIGDDFWIKQVVINLLTNAIKFTSAGGQVKLNASFEAASAGNGIFKISVKDSGVGIAKEDIEKIFEDFIQVETPDNESKQVGTGLGLAICKRIVDLYGGNISVESEVGKGSEFKVSIPLAIVSPGTATETNVKKTEVSKAFLKDKKILVADDTKMNLILVSKIMDKYGMKYDLANDGQEAFRMFEAGRYDLLITDIHMPVMDGVELTENIRKHSEVSKSRMPILGFTGSSTPDSKSQYISSGMNDVLQKPFDEGNLLSVIERLIKEN